METIKLPNVDATDDEDLVAGQVYIHNIDDVVKMDDIPNNAFEYVFVAPVLSGIESDAQFKAHEKDLHEAVPQYGKQPFMLGKKDTVPVNAELGAQDASAGIYKTTDGRDARYYVVAQSGAAMASRQLKQKVGKQLMTWRQLLADPDFQYVRYAAERNTKRLAYNVARAARVGIRHEPDAGAFTVNAHYGAPPMRAKGGLLQSTTSIAQIAPNKVAVYHRVRPVTQIDAECVVHAGPYEGYTLFQMKGKTKSVGLPAHVGRNATTPIVEGNIAPNRANGIIWEGDQKKMLADLHPAAFNEIGDQFLAEMRTLGWSQDGARTKQQLVPVMVKVFNPELKR